MPLSVAEFVQRWKLYTGSERSGAQPHFLDLCDLLDQPTPAQDSIGERYAFEKRVGKVYGGTGFADVWLRDHFAWEYKGDHKDLKRAYRQLNDYREALGNPPLLVVSDFSHFEVHTNFHSTPKRVYAFSLDDLLRNQVTATCPLPPLTVLRALFGDTDLLRPDRTDAQVTQDAARQFARLAERLELEERSLGATREQIAHFLMRILFCLFADSIGLLPDKVFRKLLQSEDRFQPRRFLRKLTLLFEAMSLPDGIFGEHTIRFFNGGLFDSASIIELDRQDLAILYDVSRNYDWAHIAPAIFGTLFERSLDPARRSLIGAHYTSAEDILLLIEPVLMRPLEQRWAAIRQQVLEAREVERAEEAGRPSRQARLRVDLPSETLLTAWIDELTQVRVLDPACGSGNFLYLALRRMLDLWKQARDFAVEQGISLVLPTMVSPAQLYGIETEFYAHELASVVVWIGFLQWKHENGVHEDREPILDKLTNIEHADAILRYDEQGKPYEPAWPRADYILGNPPFLGDKKMRSELDTNQHPSYVDDLRRLYEARVPGGADLVTYWFEKARRQIETGAATRAGLLATNSIRMVGNRPVLERIEKTGNIFMAWSDRPWLLEGAAVRVSMIGFDDGTESQHTLDGLEVTQIHADLTAESNLTSALPLAENEGLCFLGMMKGGPFDITAADAQLMLSRPLNPNGRPNSDVVKRRLGGRDITNRDSGGWLIDFGVNMPEAQAALYEWPFEYVKKHVKPLRDVNRRARMQQRWWIHGEARPGLRRAIAHLPRCIVTPEVAKHRLFVWMDTTVIPDHKLHVFPKADDYFFGVLHSAAHEEWTLATCSWIGKGNDPSYNSDSVFDTFPFPWPPGTEPTEQADPRVQNIAEAARALVHLRDAWLNPPAAESQPKLSEADLKTRTLTNLYNQRPAWLANAHRTLDEAVFAAYGWPPSLSKQDILARLLALNHERAAT